MARMHDTLAEAARGGSWSVLLRHAERPPIPPGEFGSDLPITDAGRRSALALGRRLGASLRRLVTSPVRRCVETAEALRTGAGVAVEIKLDLRLGAPGVWIADATEAERWFLELGAAEVVRRQIAGEALPGMRALDDGAARLIDLLFAPVGDDDGLALYVTHDAVMAPLMANLYGLPALDDVMPHFLEAAVFDLRPRDPTCTWRGRRSQARDGRRRE